MVFFIPFITAGKITSFFSTEVAGLKVFEFGNFHNKFFARTIASYFVVMIAGRTVGSNSSFTESD